MRRSIVGAAAMAILIVGALPAQAIADAGLARASGPIPWALTAECTPVAGYTTNATEINFVVKATAHGEGAAFGTQVGCSVYREDGTKVGGCAQALIGPAAACTDTVSMPVGDVPAICVTASALYATGIAQLPTCPEHL